MNLKQRAFELLSFGGRHLKTDLIYLTKGGTWLSLSQGIAVISGFLISLAFANLFSKESFGTYKFILSMVGILSAFSLTGLGASVIQSVASGFRNSLSKNFKINLRWSVGIFLGGLIMSLYYYLNQNALLSYSFLLAGITYPIISSAGLYSSFLQGKKDFKRDSLYNIIRNFSLTTAIILALFFSRSLPIIISVYFIVGAILALFFYVKTRDIYKNETGKDDSGIVSYGKHLSLIGVIGTIAGYLDKILIFHYLGAAPLAIYAFAIAPVEQLQGGKKILSSLIQPKLAERPFEEIQKSAPHKALLLALYALTLAGVWIFSAPYFYKFLFPQYLDSVFYSQIYSLTLLAIAGTVFNETLTAHKKKKELYFYRTIIPVVQIILFFILLPLYGLMGLIITHIIMRSFSTLVGYYFVMRPFKASSS